MLIGTQLVPLVRGRAPPRPPVLHAWLARRSGALGVLVLFRIQASSVGITRYPVSGGPLVNPVAEIDSPGGPAGKVEWTVLIIIVSVACVPCMPWSLSTVW